MNTIKITPAQLTQAQVRGSAVLEGGFELCAISMPDGTWKYILSAWPLGQVVRVVYAERGLDAALNALNEGEQ
jgi:hypothetical protein